MRTFFLLCILLSLQSAFCQNKAFTPEYFPNDESALAEAKTAFRDGDIFYDNGQTYCKYQLESEWFCRSASGFYDEALIYYRKAFAFNPDNAELNFKMGACYFANIKTDSAYYHFKLALDLDSKVDEQLLYFLGRCAQGLGFWEPALGFYTDYQSNVKAGRYSEKKLLRNESELNLRIAQCQSGMQMKIDSSVLVRNLGANVNTVYSEYSPVLSASGYSLLMTAKRPDYRMKPEDLDSIAFETDEENYMENIYLSYYKDSSWTKLKRLGDIITIVGEHSAALDLSHNSETLLMYKSTKGGDIYAGKFTDGNWDGVYPLQGAVNSNQFEPSASLSTDGKLLYFSSTKNGGFGSRDLYVSQLDSNGVWGEPQNLGENVNTQSDEDAVFVTAGGDSLYFSSNGPGGLGGYDLYLTYKTDSGWAAPQNLGLPINSAYDDIFYSESDGGDVRFFSSDRHGGFGKMDIYMIADSSQNGIISEFEEHEKTGISLFADSAENVKQIAGDVEMSVYISDYANSKPLAAQVSLREVETGSLVYLDVTGSDGTFDMEIEGNHSYSLTIAAKGYLPYTEEVFGVRGAKKYEVLARMIKVPELSVAPVSTDRLNKEKVSVSVVMSDFFGHETLLADVSVADEETGQILHRYEKVKKFDMWAEPGKSYSIYANAEGYVPQHSHINISDGQADEQVVINLFSDNNTPIIMDAGMPDSIPELIAFWGKVREFNTGGAVEAVVHVFAVDSKKEIMSVRTDKKGLYKMALPKNEYFRFEVEANGYVRQNGFVNSTNGAEYVYVNTQVLKVQDAVLKNNVEELLVRRKQYRSVLLTGMVKDLETDKTIDAILTVSEPNQGMVLAVAKSEADGSFTCAVPDCDRVLVQIESEGYGILTQELNLYNVSGVLEINAELQPNGRTDYVVELPNVYFEPERSDFSESFLPELKSILRFLELKPDLVLRIAGHTDSDGEEAFNEKLAKNRAEAIAHYLMNKGLDEQRVRLKALGETVPVADNSTEDGKQKNRRVELRIAAK